MPKKINYSELIKETLILTVAVAVIAAAVFFFLVPSHASVSSISGLGIVLSNFIPMLLCDHNDFKCTALNHRIFHLRKRIWNQNSLYEHYASAVSWTF